MAFISLFEVIGPNMVGPSSSHTAGAASMALLARKLFPGKGDLYPVWFFCQNLPGTWDRPGASGRHYGI